MRIFINCCLYFAIGLILGTTNIDFTTWQYWAIMLLILFININAILERT